MADAALRPEDRLPGCGVRGASGAGGPAGGGRDQQCQQQVSAFHGCALFIAGLSAPGRLGSHYDLKIQFMFDRDQIPAG
jgi:hypothetical protein